MNKNYGNNLFLWKFQNNNLFSSFWKRKNDTSNVNLAACFWIIHGLSSCLFFLVKPRFIVFIYQTYICNTILVYKKRINWISSRNNQSQWNAIIWKLWRIYVSRTVLIVHCVGLLGWSCKICISEKIFKLLHLIKAGLSLRWNTPTCW